MTEVNTFSALVDDTIRRTGRPEKRADIVSYARQSMRECQILGKFRQDMTEDTLTATGDGYIWTLPNYFREFKSVRYGLYNNRDEMIYPRQAQPSERQRNLEYFYYLGVDYSVFKGVSVNVKIDVAYFSFFRKLAYYVLASRPATFSLEDEVWTYLTATTDVTKEAARALVTNWMLIDWYDLVLEGTCAKVHKAVGDPRAPSSFALYKSLQNDFVMSVAPSSYSEALDN